VKRALGPGGAIETLKKARDDGKVPILGFSAHTTKGALEAMKGFRFDTVMFPINFVEHFAMGFGRPCSRRRSDKARRSSPSRPFPAASGRKA